MVPLTYRIVYGVFYIEDIRGLKIDMNFFLKMLNGERLVNLKHKPLETRR